MQKIHSSYLPKIFKGVIKLLDFWIFSGQGQEKWKYIYLPRYTPYRSL